MSEENRLLPAATSGASLAMQSAEIQQMNAMFQMAQMVPRNRANVAAEVKTACLSVSLAEKSMYCYRRGGQLIMGPSVKLIEEIVQFYGRVRSGWRMVGRKGNSTEVYIYAIDMETLNVSDLVLLVPDPQFKNRDSSEEDIYLNCANFASRRKRACLEKILPTGLKQDAVDQCEETLKHAYKDFKARLGKMVEVFKEEFGVTKDQIEAFLQCKVDAANIYQYVRMRGVYNSLSDQASKPSDWFRGAPTAHVKPAEDKKGGKTTRKDQKPKDPPPNVDAEQVIPVEKPADKEPAPPAAEQEAKPAPPKPITGPEPEPSTTSQETENDEAQDSEEYSGEYNEEDGEEASFSAAEFG